MLAIPVQRMETNTKLDNQIGVNIQWWWLLNDTFSLNLLKSPIDCIPLQLYPSNDHLADPQSSSPILALQNLEQR